MTALTVFAFAASPRAESHNRKLLNAAVKELNAAGCEVDVFDLRTAQIPVFDEDQLRKQVPAGVADFKLRVAKATATLIVTPEYNYSIPGVLKNVLDWASRPPATNPFKGKLAAHIGATSGMGGTQQGQLALRHVLSMALQAWVLPGAAMGLSGAEQAFDQNGELIDPVGKKNLSAFIGRFVEELKAW